MIKFFWTALILLLSNISDGQNIKVICSERQEKNENASDPIIVRKCFIKNFKLISTGYPDYKGRYSYDETLYEKKSGKYVEITNAEMFNSNQPELLAKINQRIQEDFQKFRSDSNTKDCFENIDSIPKYSMNELKISFQGDDIWFEVDFGLAAVCRAVDGTIITFNINKIAKYLK